MPKSESITVQIRGDMRAVKAMADMQDALDRLGRSLHLTRARRAVPKLQWIRGMCSDEEAHYLIDAKIAEVIDLLDPPTRTCPTCGNDPTVIQPRRRNPESASGWSPCPDPWHLSQTVPDERGSDG